jgi:hypothetical protein
MQIRNPCAIVYTPPYSSELYDDNGGKTCPAYSAFNLDIKPAAFKASGRRSTPVGRSPNTEGESITENRFK